MTQKIRVGAVQAEPAWIDLQGEVEKTIQLIQQASRDGVNDLAGLMPGDPPLRDLNSTSLRPADILDVPYRLEQERREIELQLQVQETTLEEYLRDCHHYIFKALRIADKSVSSTGRGTRVDGKRYPRRLCRWDDFADVQRDHFDTIKNAFGDRRLFPRSMKTRDKADDGCPDPAAIEKHIDKFEKVAIESPVRRIFQKLLEVEPRTQEQFNFVQLRLSCNNLELKGQTDSGQAGDSNGGEEMHERRRRSGPSKRVASEQTVQRTTYPDGLGLRKHPEGDEDLAFVYEYKAARKLMVEDLKSALPGKTFMEVTTDAEMQERDKTGERIAMALTQVFDYMVDRGVAYGYLTAGHALVFLHIKQRDLRTLYYHLSVPDEEADDENGGLRISYTAVAQLASFCLLTLRSEALQGPLLEKPEPDVESWELLEREGMDSSPSASSSQATTGSLYEEEDKSKVLLTIREYSLRSRSTRIDTAAIRTDNENEDDDPSGDPTRVLGRTGASKRKGTPWSRSSEGEGNEMSSNSDYQPTRQYCTQACLLGLKRGWYLDENCPNVSLHRTVEGSIRHPISASEFASVVGERLRQNIYRDCVALDPYGVLGKIGAIGALFKLELAPYGYTFVGKGTQSVHLRCLQHESLVYSRLESLQGEVVPVHLRIVNLAGGYVLPGAARVLHMMLMSWGGEIAARADVPDLSVKLRRSSRAVWSEGVDHCDKREPNILWNKERRRVMLIDFDRALRPAAKHKQLSKLSGKGKKRNGKETFLDVWPKTRNDGKSHAICEVSLAGSRYCWLGWTKDLQAELFTA
ncbi:hypothetical protein V1525DRAFT_391123 [Lipomyces kononenkoae]|uniref:Uncharacterized protein n=1 Tax=Lipomyces kononenkoae TaxID=34357 RepID=A0ACC3ST23_LIPKO